jgi:hypothetical protein
MLAVVVVLHKVLEHKVLAEQEVVQMAHITEMEIMALPI